jgi:hypothetical protein
MIRSAPATFRSRSFWRKRRLLELVFRQSLYQAFISLFRRARVGHAIRLGDCKLPRSRVVVDGGPIRLARGVPEGLQHFAGAS